jgi:hypothetical protein
MPLRPMPATIELSDFTQGWVPKAEEVGVPPEALLGASNVMVDAVTGSVLTRKGYKRVFDTSALDGYRLYTVRPYTDRNGVRYIMCVLGTGFANTANNIQVWRWRVSDGNFVRVDTADRAWLSGNGRHWGTTIDGIYYGGGLQEEMYSYDPTRGTPWDADPGTPDYPEWVEPSSGTSGTERARDYAFKKNDAVVLTYTKDAVEYTENFKYRGNIKVDQYGADIRYDEWDVEVVKYKKGDRVSTKYDVNSNGAYWRSWECVEGHEPTVGNQPGTGSGFWKKVKASKPVDDDGNMNAKEWNRIPAAPKTNIGVWHGNRLFARDDDGVGKQTLIYSRLAKVADPDNDAQGVVGKAGDPQWDPDDWRTGGADGAGFIPLETKEGDDITALVSFGYYLLVFKEQSTHVVAGVNPETWTVRQLSNNGCAYVNAAAEHDGWVYFISDEGFFRTDGTAVKRAPGSEKVDAWLRAAIDWSANIKDIEMWSFDGYLWMTLPTERSQVNNKVVLYEPLTASFWPLDLSIQTATVQKRNGRDQLFFSGVNNTGKAAYPSFAWTGAAHASPSTKTLSAVTTTNYITNPNFGGGETQWDMPIGWTRFDTTKVRARVTKAAAHRGQFGVELQNLRDKDSTAGAFAGYEGIYQITGPGAGTYIIQAAVRRRNWQDDPRKKPDVKFVGNDAVTAIAGTQYLGDGWHKVWGVFAVLDGIPRKCGILVGPGATVSFDEAILTTADSLSVNEGPIPYFDGNGGQGGARPYLFQYAHEDAFDAAENWTDDTADAVYAGQNFGWYARTSWLTFGVLQEERRIRRMWALARGNDTLVGIRSFRNFQGVDDGGYSDSVSPKSGVVYHEGQLPEDCHAIQVEVEGNKAPAAFLGVALDTEPRRIRFGRR